MLESLWLMGTGTLAGPPVVGSLLGSITAAASTVLAAGAIATAKFLPRMYLDIRDIKKEVYGEHHDGEKSLRTEIREARADIVELRRQSPRRRPSGDGS